MIATRRPMVFLTSNGTRDLSEALKRCCLYLHLTYPSVERERDILLARVLDLSEALAEQVARLVRTIRIYPIKHDGPVGRLLSELGRHPWRPTHIHLLLSAAGHRSLITQVHIAGGPYLDDDTISGVKEDLVAPVVEGRISFDMALARVPSAEPPAP